MRKIIKQLYFSIVDILPYSVMLLGYCILLGMTLLPVHEYSVLSNGLYLAGGIGLYLYVFHSYAFKLVIYEISSDNSKKATILLLLAILYNTYSYTLLIQHLNPLYSLTFSTLFTILVSVNILYIVAYMRKINILERNPNSLLTQIIVFLEK